MLKLILAAWGLVAGTVVIHAAGLVLSLKPVLRSAVRADIGYWAVTWLIVRTAWWLIVIHMIEIAFWGLFYWWQRCLPDAESSFYFAGVTYTTVGYGDLVLPKQWRLLGPIQALTGILMCGLSTGFFFAMVNRIHEARSKTAA